MIRVIVLMTLMPDADVRGALIALAGGLAMVPWARAWAPASARACGDWRNALGPEPLEELRDIVLRASWAEHEGRDWRAVAVGRARPLKTGSLDPAGTDKAVAEQKLLDAAMEQCPHLFAKDRLWLMDRKFPGTAGIARLIARTHTLIRLKSDIPLRRITKILPDGSYLAEITGDGVTVTVRVIEYFADVEGQDVPEMFCLITDLMDIREKAPPKCGGRSRGVVLYGV